MQSSDFVSKIKKTGIIHLCHRIPSGIWSLEMVQKCISIASAFCWCMWHLCWIRVLAFFGMIWSVNLPWMLLSGFFFLHSEPFVVLWIEECRQFSLVLLESAALLVAWRRDTDRGSTLWSSLKGSERATVNQTRVGTVSKATLGKLWGDGVELIIIGFPERVHTTLDWTEYSRHEGASIIGFPFAF